MMIMLVRLGLSLRAADELRRSCAAVTDRAITDPLDQLIGRCLQSERQVRLLVADKLSSPVAMGFIWPVIILPAPVVSGTSPEMMRAILAHELAHIRRQDYLVNLGQLLVETILFFNPAVWWISRQVRIEREACCDAEAAGLIGDETEYAKSLADYVSSRQTGVPIPALAFGQEKESGSLSDRVRRLLVPGYRPRLRLPLQGLMLFLLLGGITLTVLHQGSRMAVAAGAKLLSPKERIEKIRAVQESHSIPKTQQHWDNELAQKPESRVKISGKVVDPEGNILTDNDIWVRARSERPSYSASATLNNNDGIVKDDLQPGEIHLVAESKRYAPALLGPFMGEIGGKLENLKFVMRPGFTGRVKLLDPAGKPITNAVVTGQYEKTAYAGIGKHSPNMHGIIEVPHSVVHELALKVQAPGYQHAEKIFTLSSNSIPEWRLESATAARIKIVNDAGEPIAGARARLLEVKGANSMGYGEGSREVAGRSDANGVLTLNQLRDDSVYWFLVEAPGYRRDFLRRVHPGETDRVMTLGPPIVVSGVVDGDLTQLRKRWQGRGKNRVARHYITYANHFKINESSSSYNKPWFVRIEGDKAYFEITNLWPGRIMLACGQERISRELKASISGLRLHLKAPTNQKPGEPAPPLPEREVVFEFSTPAGNPPANGELALIVNKKRPAGGFDYERRRLTVTNSRASLKVPVGSKIDYEPTDFTGYWFKSPIQTEIQAGKQAHVFKIDCIPAGAIYGTISEEDGSAARGVMISLVEVERAQDRTGSLNVDIKNSASSSDRTERFTATPLPLGGTYMIVAHRSGYYVTSKPFKVTRENPLHHTKLVLRKGERIQGRLLHDDGTPAVGMRYSMSFVPKTGSHSFGTSDQFTDRLGRFTFRKVNDKVNGSYFLNVHENPGYQKLRVPLDLSTSSHDVTVKLGRIVTGTVVDEATGWPIPGLRVYAMLRPYSTNRTGYIDADSKTDRKGNFHFTTMDDGGYLINVSGGKLIGGDGIKVRGGQKEHIRLAVKLHAWSKLQPIDPSVKKP